MPVQATQSLTVPPPSPEPNYTQSRTGGRLSFNFKSVPWELALRRIAQEAGMSLQMNRLPPGTFTFFDDNQYSATEAIDLLNDHLLPLGFILARNSRNLVLLNTKDALPENLVPHVDSSDLPRLGRNELASIAIPVYQGTVKDAEREAKELVGPLGIVVALTSPRQILVTDTGSNLRRIHGLMTSGTLGGSGQPSLVHQLRNTSAEEVALAINEFLAINRQPASSGTSDASSVARVVIAEKTTNSLLVRGTPAELKTVRALIQQLDGPPPQVLIQALLVEVELGNTDEFGVELGIQDSVLFDRSVIDNILTVTETMTTPGGNQTTNQRIISQTAAPGFNFNNQPLGNNTAITPGTVAGQALSNFGVGRVNGDLGFGGLVLSAGSDSVNVLLRALAAKYKLEVLSRPQIRTVDNHEALIQIGRQVPVVDGVSVTAVGSANPVIRQDQSGIILKVTPRISPDGLVLINVNAEKSAFQLAPGTGVPIFTDATNGNVIEAPVKDITTAETTVSMQNGQTIILGGMITRDLIKVRRKVPYLADIPYAGELFQYRLDRKTRKELLIFLTPHIVRNTSQSDQQLMTEAARVHTPYETVEQIHGPIPRMCPQHGTNPNASCGHCLSYYRSASGHATPSPITPVQHTGPMSAGSIQHAAWSAQQAPGHRRTGSNQSQPDQSGHTGLKRGWKPFSNLKTLFGRSRGAPGTEASSAGEQARTGVWNDSATGTAAPVFLPVARPQRRR